MFFFGGYQLKYLKLLRPLSLLVNVFIIIIAIVCVFNFD